MCINYSELISLIYSNILIEKSNLFILKLIFVFFFGNKCFLCEIVRAFQILGDVCRLVFIILENILRVSFTVYPSGLNNCWLNEEKNPP